MWRYNRNLDESTLDHRMDYRFFDDDYALSTRLSRNNGNKNWLTVGSRNDGDDVVDDPFGIFTALLVTTVVVAVLLLLVIPLLWMHHHQTKFAHYNSQLHKLEQELEINESAEQRQHPPQYQRQYYYWSRWSRQIDPTTKFSQYLMGWIVLSCVVALGSALLTVYFAAAGRAAVETLAWQNAATAADAGCGSDGATDSSLYYYGSMTVRNVTVLQSEYSRRVSGLTWYRRQVFKTMLDVEVEWPCNSNSNATSDENEEGGSKTSTGVCASRLIYKPCTAVVACTGVPHNDNDDEQEENEDDVHPIWSGGLYPHSSSASPSSQSRSKLVSPEELHVSTDCSLEDLYTSVLETEQCWKNILYLFGNEDGGNPILTSHANATQKMDLFGDCRTCQAYYTPPVGVPRINKRLAFVGIIFVGVGVVSLFFFVCMACEPKATSGAGGLPHMNLGGLGRGNGRPTRRRNSSRIGGGSRSTNMHLDEILSLDVVRRRRGYGEDDGTEAGSIGSLEKDEVLNVNVEVGSMASENNTNSRDRPEG